MQKLSKIIFTLTLLCFGTVYAADSVVIISDSTAVDYRNSTNAYHPGKKWDPMSGWGERTKDDLRDGVIFFNGALGGFSSKLYVDRRLQRTAKNFRKDGWLLLSFGCNDARPSSSIKNRTTKPETTFPHYMGIITDTAEKAGMKIVVISPMPSFEMVKGKFRHPLLAPYAEASKKFAADKGYYFIDLYVLLTEYFQGMTEKEIKSHYMFINPGESPNWPKGRSDRLHLSKKGSAAVWKIIRKEIDKNIPELSKLFKTDK